MCSIYYLLTLYLLYSVHFFLLPFIWFMCVAAVTGLFFFYFPHCYYMAQIFLSPTLSDWPYFMPVVAFLGVPNVFVWQANWKQIVLHEFKQSFLFLPLIFVCVALKYSSIINRKIGCLVITKKIYIFIYEYSGSNHGWCFCAIVLFMFSSYKTHGIGLRGESLKKR